MNNNPNPMNPNLVFTDNLTPNSNMEKKTAEQVLKETFDKCPVKTPRLEALKMDLSATEFIVSAMQAYAAQETKPLQERIDQLSTLYDEMEANQEPLENRCILAEAKINVLQERIKELEDLLTYINKELYVIDMNWINDIKIKINKALNKSQQ